MSFVINVYIKQSPLLLNQCRIDNYRVNESRVKDTEKSLQFCGIVDQAAILDAETEILQAWKGIPILRKGLGKV